MEDTLHTTGGEKETPTRLQTLPSTRVDAHKTSGCKVGTKVRVTNCYLLQLVPAPRDATHAGTQVAQNLRPDRQTMDLAGFTSVLLKEHSSKTTPDNVLLDS